MPLPLLSFPALRCIIQDQKALIDTARSKLAELPAEKSKRVEPQEHNFFAAQPVKGVDVYLLRMVLHDWKDPEAAKILKQLVDATKPDSRILIIDMVLPTPGSASITLEAALRQKDLAMLDTLNAKKREVDDWRSVLQKQTHAWNSRRSEDRMEASILSSRRFLGKTQERMDAKMIESLVRSKIDSGCSFSRCFSIKYDYTQLSMPPPDQRCGY